MKCQDTYSRVETYTYPDAIVRVHFPDLTEEENARRHKILHDAAAAILISEERLKQEKDKKKAVV